MKYKGRLKLFTFLLILFISMAAYNVVFSFGFSEKGRETINLQTITVSDFGDEKDQTNGVVWKVRFSRFAKPSDPTKEMSGWDSNACNVRYFEAKPLGLPQEVDVRQKWSLGVKAQFIKKGYNWIELYPAKTDGKSILDSQGAPNADVEAKLEPLPLVGIIKSLDMWVWGGNYNYWIEFYLLDYKGFLHRIPVGDIKYVGWRNLRTKIPEYIPQAENRVPFLKPLKLQTIKIWAYPDERVDQFYAYFDYLQVQTDVYLERFNGDDLATKAW
ncbi:MAG: flagellar filament outer layer protein FlaA [Brevinematia bacterium]